MTQRYNTKGSKAKIPSDVTLEQNPERFVRAYWKDPWLWYDLGIPMEKITIVGRCLKLQVHGRWRYIHYDIARRISAYIKQGLTPLDAINAAFLVEFL